MAESPVYNKNLKTFIEWLNAACYSINYQFFTLLYWIADKAIVTEFLPPGCFETGDIGDL